MSHLNWDLQLLRKFSNTSHSRLLNQLRSELKAKPIQRSHPIKRTQNKSVKQETQTRQHTNLHSKQNNYTESQPTEALTDRTETASSFIERLKV